jgi:hypothetical protein
LDSKLGKSLTHRTSLLLGPRSASGGEAFIRKPNHLRTVGEFDPEILQVSNGYDHPGISVRTAMVADGDHVLTHSARSVNNV